MIQKLALRIFFLIYIFYNLTSQAYAQHICGTTYDDQLSMVPSPDENEMVHSRQSTRFIPIRLHLVTDNEGKGLPSIGVVLDQFARINADFDSVGFKFYMAGTNFFNVIKDINIYEAPLDNISSIVNYKLSSAVNVFVTKNTYEGNGTGTVLAYYSPSGDHIVMLSTQLGKTNNTLSHEIGHFFNLRHTFFGWEQDPYSATKHGNPLTSRTAPSGNVAVELSSGSNCNSAADQICDTPPDYNFGFGASSCNWIRDVKDPDGNAVIPMVNNQMGYFNNCSKYRFSQGQINRMLSNLNASNRFAINTGYIPTTSPITSAVAVTTPTLNSTVSNYNYVPITWTAVGGATHYLVEITDGRSNIYEIVNTNSYIAKTLSPNVRYVLKVRPFNEGFTDTKTTTSIFSTGSQTVSTQQVLLSEVKIELAQNPVSISNGYLLASYVSPSVMQVQISLIAIDGKLMSRSTNELKAGQGSIGIKIEDLEPGHYILNMSSKNGTVSKKLIITP